MKRLVMLAKRAAIAAAFLQITGCASTAPVVDKQRYFWPPLPDTPRIEWLAAYTGQDDVEPPGPFAKILGSGESIGLDKPVHIASNGQGKIYVVDQKNGVVFFDLPKKQVKILGGVESLELLKRPSGIALDGEGNVYVGDAQERRIVVFGQNGEISRTMDLSARLKNIGSFAIDKARKVLIVPDIWEHKVVMFDLNGNYIRGVGKRGTQEGDFNYPSSVAVDRQGNILVCDAMNARIQRFTHELKLINTFGKRGDGPGEFNIIKGVSVDSEGHIYVTDGKSHNLGIYNEQGEVLLSIGGPFSLQPGLSVTPGGFLLPQGIYIDQNDTIYIVDSMNSRFQMFQYLTERYLQEHPVTAEAK
ncbi:6-bladed beta-propeller [Geobacter sp. DSM 9736]|uniref:6-bladed beta-propeller n=1 Tax=Geobacter sp. DSM 9736 TaxID=1277350 RepID=UPI000B51256D|nr:6-bladed beta-propeller [Geobacter sp. DSM 9736]SNB46642.1 NHL repeat-containing protein [Geobacter sp. DSM 9736]